ncbi:MAG TPA: lamin tail domain-containing protein [Cyclobacteriaceae bacterium]|jgi:hypothetical protein|nr:lamin tail domain-containing protein [Cyclobacteriaceae bacterium]
MAKSIEIVRIDRDSVGNEYILLLVNEDVNLKGYAIVDKTFDSEGVESDIFRHIYFFRSLLVQKGDYVALWTKKGTYFKNKTTDNSPLHNLYWGSNENVWNNSGDTATLIKYAVIDQHS